mgnify:CR=1 FL=1
MMMAGVLTNILLLALLVFILILVIRSRRLFAVVVLAGAYSLVSAAMFVNLDAVDVAFTEAAVGAGISTVLFLAAMAYLPGAEKTPPEAKGLGHILPALVICCLAGALLAAWHASGAARARWATLALLIVGATLVAMLVMRALSVAHLFALPGIAWLIVLLFRRAQAAPSAIIRVLGSAALVLLSPAGLSAVWIALASHHPAEDKSAAADCRAQSILPRLDRLPPATLFAPIDMGPDILLRTRHSVIATAHHRNVAGLTEVIRAFVADPQQARSIVAGSGATYLVGCDSLTELRSYARENPQGLAAMVRQGRAPDWLVPLPGKGPLRVWRIRRAGS